MGAHPFVMVCYGIMLKRTTFEVEQLRHWLQQAYRSTFGHDISPDLEAFTKEYQENTDGAFTDCIRLLEEWQDIGPKDQVKFGHTPSESDFIDEAFLYCDEMYRDVCIRCERYVSFRLNRMDTQAIDQQLHEVCDRYSIVWKQPQFHLLGYQTDKLYSPITKCFYGLLQPDYQLPSGKTVDTPPIPLLKKLKAIWKDGGPVWFEEIPEKLDNKEDDCDRYYLLGVLLKKAIPANLRAEWDQLLRAKCTTYHIPFATPDLHEFIYVL